MGNGGSLETLRHHPLARTPFDSSFENQLGRKEGERDRGRRGGRGGARGGGRDDLQRHRGRQGESDAGVGRASEREGERGGVLQLDNQGNPVGMSRPGGQGGEVQKTLYPPWALTPADVREGKWRGRYTTQPTHPTEPTHPTHPLHPLSLSPSLPLSLSPSLPLSLSVSAGTRQGPPPQGPPPSALLRLRMHIYTPFK